ncbi:response regulator transcription factor [Reichenbachiella sp. MALMAid0571]|uniref:response regulator transcription factor n=1 Tax=Reichenbachiella sp. MALMAid0571 TaxID=3143939 RepID=UPI0032DFC70E
MNILIVEDEHDLAESIIKYLSQEGYHCEWANSFREASEKIHLHTYDCILVDINLPDGSGIKVIERLKRVKSESGIIIISARDSVEDKIIGLEIGADDYLTKPFHLSELNARVKSLIRRRNFDGNNEILFKEITILPQERLVTIHGEPIKLTKKEYDLLLYFVSNPNRVITKESIAEHLWGDHMDMADSFDFIYAHLKNLRKKILEKKGGDYIQTIYGVGYKFTRF